MSEQLHPVSIVGIALFFATVLVMSGAYVCEAQRRLSNILLAIATLAIGALSGIAILAFLSPAFGLSHAGFCSVPVALVAVLVFLSGLIRQRSMKERKSGDG